MRRRSRRIRIAAPLPACGLGEQPRFAPKVGAERSID